MYFGTPLPNFKQLFPALLTHLKQSSKLNIDVLREAGFNMDTDGDKITYLVRQIRKMPVLNLESALRQASGQRDLENVAFEEKRASKIGKVSFQVFSLLCLGWYLSFAFILLEEFVRFDLSGDLTKFFDIDILFENGKWLWMSHTWLVILGYLFSVVMIQIKRKGQFWKMSSLGNLTLTLARNLEIIIIVFPKINVWFKFTIYSLLQTFILSAILMQISESPGAVGYWILWVPPVILVVTGAFYFKRFVLGENPIFQLAMLHPDGRRLLQGEITYSS